MERATRPLDELPHPVEVDETVWIPTRDGTRLAARVWLPEGASSAPVPAIVEYIPYRRRDHTRARDELNHPYLAAHGYATLRVDLRGSGDSEGVLADEYLEVELEDGEDVLAWVAAQPWCDGRVGMMGISWGGFNALQLAARRPPELGAIAITAVTDDRYADDVHYMGGCLLTENVSWAALMFAYNASPPDPAIVGERWRELWHARLEGNGVWLATWLEHQRRDAYWAHGSVCEDYGAIDVPVLVTSGWADGYTNAVFRLLENLDAPRLGIVGPWRHVYPHMGTTPGPAIGFLQEILRWFDRWLKGVETGVEDEPMLRAYLQDHVRPYTRYDVRPGRWVGEDAWPSPDIETRRYVLADRQLRDAEDAGGAPETSVPIRSPSSVGLFAGKWLSFEGAPDEPGDQREDDGGSLVFDSPPLPERLEVLGAPMVDLAFTPDAAVAQIAVRLSDVAPDGAATRITYGLLNLTHRDGHARPQPLVPGRRELARVRLNHVGYAIPRGHRLRVSLSTSYWPLAWPPPQATTTVIHGGASHLDLPVRGPSGSPAEVVFPPPESAPPLDVESVSPGEDRWRVVRDLSTDGSVLEIVKDRGRERIPEIDLERWNRAEERYSIVGDDVTSARADIDWRRGFRRGDWCVETRSRTILTCDERSFHVHAQLDAFEGSQRVHSSERSREIPRDGL